MAEDQRSTPEDIGADPLAEEPDPSFALRPAVLRGDEWRPPPRRRRSSRGVLTLLVSMAALALGVIAVVMAADGNGPAVRYVPVRPPEVIGPAPAPGEPLPPPDSAPLAAPATPPAGTAAPAPPPAAGDTAAPAPAPAPAPGEGVAPTVPGAADPPPPPPPPAGEPVVAAAGRVEPSVVLLQTSEGQGSGIIYDTSGLVLTAAHVVDGAEPLDDLFVAYSEQSGPPGDEELSFPGEARLLPGDRRQLLAPGQEVPDVIVQLASGVRTGGKVLAADADLDVAVVQIDPSLNFSVAEIAPLSSVEVGQTAVAVGSPFGMDNVVTVGVVSAVNQVLRGEGMPPIGMIQTDAPINFGNSGGALADLDGRVIGMNVAIQSNFGGGNIGVGFATPIEVARWIAEELRAGREVRFGFLGITGYTPAIGEPGAIVASVTQDGPAEAAGMMVDDRVVRFAGQAVGSMGELSVAVRLQPPGKEVEVEVVRGDLLLRLFVPLGDRGASLPEDLSAEDDLVPGLEP